MRINKRASTFCEGIERESINSVKFIPLPLLLILICSTLLSSDNMTGIRVESK